jgi:chitodextrinase
MFKRNVKMDGMVYAYHEVDLIEHVRGRSTSVRVQSYKESPYLGASAQIDKFLTFAFDDTLTFSAAEEAVMRDERYVEYVDPEEAVLQELAGDLTDEQAATVPQLYPEWEPDGTYTVGDRVRYSDGFYKCLQGHTAQADWNPAEAPSLWTAIIDASVVPIDGYPVWQQPESTNPYMTGDKVTYGESIWESFIDNNVWAPGVYGWDLYVEQQPAPTPEPTPEPQTYPEWEQPDSTNPYMLGDRVTFEGAVYESTVDNNVWAPNVYGWVLVQ